MDCGLHLLHLFGTCSDHALLVRGLSMATNVAMDFGAAANSHSYSLHDVRRGYRAPKACLAHHISPCFEHKITLMHGTPSLNLQMRVFIPKHGLLLLNQMPGSIGHKFLVKQANFTIGLGSHSKVEPLKAQCAMFRLHMRESGGESYQCHKARTGLN